MSQTTQLSQFPQARAGQLIGPLSLFHINGKGIAELAIAAGLFVTRGTGDGAKLPTSAAEVQSTGLGFAMLDTTHGSKETSTEFEIGASVPCVEYGPGVVVQSAEQMSVGDPVFVIHAASNRGKVRNDADTANAAQLYGAVVTQVFSSTLCKIRMLSGAVAGATGATGPTGPTGATGPTGPTGPTGE